MTIKELREKTGLSQSKFASYFGISVRDIQEWEQEWKNPPPYYILKIILILMALLQSNNQEVQTLTKYVNVKTFNQYLATSMELPLDKDFPEPYIAAVVSAGILTGSDFDNDFSVYITRTDAAVLLNHSDEYLHGDTVNADFLNWFLKKGFPT